MLRFPFVAATNELLQLVWYKNMELCIQMDDERTCEVV
jgi:hypothetical protein